MKPVDIDPAILAEPDLLARVRRANESLETELRRSRGSDQVSAAWQLVHDDLGRPVLKLAISDWSGKAETAFAPDDLADHDRVQYRMNRLWGDLLRIQSHKLLDEIQAAAAHSEGS